MALKYPNPEDLRRVVSGHIPALDGLRGIAILLVVALHFSWVSKPLSGLPEAMLGLVQFGWAGVELFFLLSGFLITGILVDSKTAENYLSSFYIRRALRILPLYYGCLFAIFVLAPILGKLGVPHMPHRFHAVQLWYWFYAGNWAGSWGHGVGYLLHFWSLAVEEQFYFVWPWVVLATTRRTLARICILLIVIGPVLRALLYFNGKDAESIYMYTSSSVDVLALGSLAALAVRDDRWIQFLIPHVIKLIYAGLSVFLLIGLVNRDLGNTGLTYIFGLTPLSIFFGGLLLRSVVTTGSNSILQRILQAGWLRAYGKYSYAIYVFHGLIFNYYNQTVLPALFPRICELAPIKWLCQHGTVCSAAMCGLFILNILGLCLLFLGAGKFSWWAFESRINRLKSRFRVRWQN